MQTVLQDLQFALRTARKSPGYLVTALCTLALGIGANTVIFSVVSGVLLRPLPFSHPDRLVQLNQIDPRNGLMPVSYPDLVDWRRQSASIDAMLAYGSISKNLDNVADPERIATVWAERGLFRMLGVEPMLGRTFRDDDPLNVVVLSAGLWKRRFARDPACVGHKISLDGEAYTVIGVMPDGFQFPYRFPPGEIWIPWEAPRQYEHSRNYRVDLVAARLKSGVTIATARAELATLSKRLESEHPQTNKARMAVVTPLSEIVAGSLRPALLTLLAAVAVVLLIACANVMNLLLARAAGRTREIAIRAALGASRARLTLQLLTESVLLSLAGGISALLVALAGIRLLQAFVASRIPRSSEIGLDWRVFSFLLGVSLITGVVFGLLPALAASRTDVQSGLKEAGSRSSGYGSSGWSGRRLRNSLVIAELALAFALLTGAGVLLRAFLNLQSAPVGFVPTNVLTLHLTIALKDYTAPGSYGRYLHALEEQLSQVPGVRAVGCIQYLPLQNWGWASGFSIAGRPPQPDGQGPRAELRYVSPGYFRALGIPLRKGRLLTDSDSSESPRVILVNETLARMYFPNEDPVGKRTNRGTIVGVVGDVHQSGVDRPVAPEIYYSFAQNTAATSDAGVSMVVSAIQPETLVNSLRTVIHRVNPNQVIFNAKTMQQVIAESFADVRLYLWLVGIFAAMALLLAIAGIYGVISHVVAARTQEFGIRRALGAGGGEIVRLVLRDSSLLVAIGLILGVAGSMVFTRMLKAFLSSAPRTDPATLAAAAILLTAVALLGCLIPARRAIRVDPNIVLKCE